MCKLAENVSWKCHGRGVRLIFPSRSSKEKLSFLQDRSRDTYQAYFHLRLLIRIPNLTKDDFANSYSLYYKNAHSSLIAFSQVKNPRNPLLKIGSLIILTRFMVE
mgnify:CR=1 FL=1